MEKNLFSVRGKTVLITGASRGIGRALALGFRDAGATVYGTATRDASLEWMLAEPGITGRSALVEDAVAMGSLLQEIHSKHGRLDCLINNAGINPAAPAASTKHETIRQIMTINFEAIFQICQSYYRIQKKTGGNIINIASITGLVAMSASSAYVASKHALIGLTRSLTSEWAAKGFQINAICPGFTDTDMAETLERRPELRARIERVIPAKRLARPEELVGPAIFLASDASSYVNGHTLVVDGGCLSTLPI